MNLNFKEYGKGKTIVILHGLLGSLDNWSTIAKSLSTNYNIITIDLPDHGKSDHTDLFSYTSIVQSLKDFLIKKKISRFSIIGHSMGGKVAIKYADLYPSNLDKLVIVDISNKYYKTERFNHIFKAIFSIDLKKINSRSEASIIISSLIKNVGERNFILKNITRNGNVFSWLPNIKLLASSIEKISERIDIKSQIKVETLFLKGENSIYIDKSDLITLNNDFFRYSLKEVKNSGHWIHAENPTDFLTEVRSFVG
tara:strand:- start:2283 stop:3044 length:762 start_codon:yes stop_codon:yes gene_type:complete